MFAPSPIIRPPGIAGTQHGLIMITGLSRPVLRYLTRFVHEHDVSELAAVSRAFRDAVGDRALAQAIARHRPRTLEVYTECLSRIRQLDRFSQEEPLTALVQGIGRITSISARSSAVDRALEAVAELPIGFRGRPLTALAGRFYELHNEDRPGRFDRILGLLEDLPFEEQKLVLEELTAALNALDAGSARDRFDALLTRAVAAPEEDRAEYLIALCGALTSLPEEGVQEAFETILQRRHDFPVDRQASLLAALATRCGRLPEAFQETGFVKVLAVVRTLPNERQVGLLISLARVFHFFPDEASRVRAFNALLDAVEPLRTDHQEELLRVLVECRYGLHAGSRAQASAAIRNASARLADDAQLAVHEALGNADA